VYFENMAELLYRVKCLEHIKLAIAFVALNIIDAVLTEVILAGGGRELNPIMRFLFEQPKWVAWTFEIGGTLVAAFGLLLIATRYPRELKVVFIALVVAMSAVCFHNGIGLINYVVS